MNENILFTEGGENNYGHIQKPQQEQAHQQPQQKLRQLQQEILAPQPQVDTKNPVLPSAILIAGQGGIYCLLLLFFHVSLLQ
ncbi:MAG: hypothetical protein M1383_04165 [Patescibacteria group bacterium]|nr:hypothetical protein [Patescibacteria group bacterium]